MTRRPRSGSGEPAAPCPTARAPDDASEPEREYADPVDEASAESMIASDPPASAALRVGGPKRAT